MIDDDLLDKIKEYLNGTSKGIHDAIEEFELDCNDANYIEDRLLDGPVGLELCSGCGWWMESCMLECDEHGMDPSCEQCSPERFEYD